MPDNKQVDEILKEYAVEEDIKPSDGSSESDDSGAIQNTGYINIPDSAKNMNNTGIYDPEQIKAVERSIMGRRPNPSHQSGKFAVSDITRPNVSYVNSVMEIRKNTADLPPRPTDSIEGYDGAVMTAQPPDDTYVPKVRKMGNSTRAKEMRARRRKKGKMDFTYAVESPDGIYTKPEKKSKKFVIQRQAEEMQKAPPVDDGNIVPLSEQSDPNALDIQIQEPIVQSEPERNDIQNKKRPPKKEKKYNNKNYDKKKSVKDYDSFEDARAIRKSITEVKDNISFRVVILFIMAFFSCYMAIGSKIGLPVPALLSSSSDPKMYCWIQLTILLLSVLISFGTFRNGIISLIAFRADSDSLTALSVLATGAATGTAAVMSPEAVQNGNIYVYIPVSIFALLINAIGKKLILSRMALNFDYISKDRDAHAIVCVENDDRAESLTRGTIGDFPILATMRKTNFIKDFARYTYSSDTGDRYSRILSPAIIIFSFLIAAAATFLRGENLTASPAAFALFVFSASVSACSCIAIPLIANIPLEKAARKYVRNRGIMLGYQSVDDFYDTNSVMVDDETFFPTGTVTLSSIKLFSGTKIENALHEAASLTVRADSVLKELFTDIIADKNVPLSRVENFSYEDSMGLCGWVSNRRILLGNRELMNNHKIEGIPTMTKEKEFTEGGKEALYLSVSGSLSAMFIIEVTASTAVVKCMKQMEKEDIAVIVRSVDPFITINRLSTLFKYPEDLIKIIPQRMIKDFEDETERVKKVSASMACSGRFSTFMQLILGTKSIRKTVAIGMTLQLAASLLGFVLVAMNSILNAFASISPLVIIGYQLTVTILIAIVVKCGKV